MISYAGIPLPLVTPQLQAWLERYLDTTGIPWQERTQATSPEALCTVMPRFDIQPHWQLNRLIWPTGLSSPATALFIASTPVLELILQQTDAGGTRVARPLKLGANVTVQMTLLDPVQVAGAPHANDGLWLLPLVDERHSFNNSSTYDMTGEDTWSDWFAAAHTALGITCPVTTISATWLKPGPVYYPEPDSPGLAILADSAAWTIGRRYVRQLNGDYQLQRYSDAASLAVPVNGFRVVSGSRHTQSVCLVPETYRLAWYQSAASTVNMPTLVGSPAPQPFDRVVWHGDRVIKNRCAVPSGQSTAADNFAAEWAREHSKWKTIRQDIAFAGIVPYTLTGGDNYVEFEVSSTMAITRVRSSHEEALESLSVRFGTLAAANCDGCGQGGGGGHVTSVQCTSGLLVVTYDNAT